MPSFINVYNNAMMFFVSFSDNKIRKYIKNNMLHESFLNENCITDLTFISRKHFVNLNNHAAIIIIIIAKVNTSKL